MPKTETCAPGIYRSQSGGYRVVASVGDRKNGGRREKRFPKTATLKQMKAWQEEQRAALRRLGLRVATGTLAADTPKYLKTVEGRLETPSNRRYELAAWLPKFGHRRRDSITRREVEDQVDTWLREKVAASTIRHRLTALSAVYRELDGRDAYNPVLGVRRPTEPRPNPNDVPLPNVIRVLQALEKRVAKNNRGRKTLARIGVLAHTGMRPSQLMRLKRDDVRLDLVPPVVVVSDPGKGGKPHWKPLSADGVTALKLFLDANAFGKFSTSSIYKSFKLACDDAAVAFFNPYRLRHTYATTLRAAGMDLADVQELVGHTTPKTTQRYASVVPEKLHKAIDALDTAFARAQEAVAEHDAKATAWQERVALRGTA